MIDIFVGHANGKRSLALVVLGIIALWIFVPSTNNWFWSVPYAFRGSQNIVYLATRGITDNWFALSCLVLQAMVGGYFVNKVWLRNGTKGPVALRKYYQALYKWNVLRILGIIMCWFCLAYSIAALGFLFRALLGALGQNMWAAVAFGVATGLTGVLVYKDQV